MFGGFCFITVTVRSGSTLRLVHSPSGLTVQLFVCRSLLNDKPVSGPTFQEILLHQPMAWTQWIVPVFNQTRSPGRWMKRYTGTLASYKSSRLGHHEPFRKLMLFLKNFIFLTVVPYRSLMFPHHWTENLCYWIMMIYKRKL